MNNFEGLFYCAHTIIIKMLIILCTWFITIVFRYNVCVQIVSKFIFAARDLSIVAGLVKYKWDAYVKGPINFFLNFLLIFEKRTNSTSTIAFWRHLILKPTGQVQSSVTAFSDSLTNYKITMYHSFIIECFNLKWT